MTHTQQIVFFNLRQLPIFVIIHAIDELVLTNHIGYYLYDCITNTVLYGDDRLMIKCFLSRLKD